MHNQIGLFEAYRMLRQHNHWGIRESIGYALWLADPNTSQVVLTGVAIGLTIGTAIWLLFI